MSVMAVPGDDPLKIAVLVYDGYTAMDALGPYDVLACLPNASIRIVAPAAGLVRNERGDLKVEAEGLDAVERPDIVVVPGGRAHRQMMQDEPLLDWIREVHRTSTWTTSVCSGALILGAAGVLEGKRATSHWLRVPQLVDFGAIPVKERVVIDGKVVTGAGMSAGIEMALRLVGLIAGDEKAQMVQVMMEYDPQPPYEGSSDKAPKEMVDAIRARAAAAFGDPPPGPGA